MKKALILGVTGQDGSYLAEHLLAIGGYEVHGMYRRSSTGNLNNLENVLDKITLHKGDMADPIGLAKIIDTVEPDELYNEADQDNIEWSYATPSYTADITYGSVARLLEIVRFHSPLTKVFQPVSATIFGNSVPPQSEESAIDPLSPYACAKAGVYHLCRYYRNVHRMFVSTGILYNHVSNRRKEEYLIQKVCKSAVRILCGLQTYLSLGDLHTQFDVGYAPEFVEGFQRLLQLSKPGDYVMGTGVAWSVEEIVMEAFRVAGITSGDYTQYVHYDKQFVRPGGSGKLVANSTKAFKDFGWCPKITCGDLIYKFVEEAQEEINSTRYTIV